MQPSQRGADRIRRGRDREAPGALGSFSLRRDVQVRIWRSCHQLGLAPCPRSSATCGGVLAARSGCVGLTGNGTRSWLCVEKKARAGIAELVAVVRQVFEQLDFAGIHINFNMENERLRAQRCRGESGIIVIHYYRGYDTELFSLPSVHLRGQAARVRGDGEHHHCGVAPERILGKLAPVGCLRLMFFHHMGSEEMDPGMWKTLLSLGFPVSPDIVSSLPWNSLRAVPLVIEGAPWVSLNVLILLRTEMSTPGFSLITRVTGHMVPAFLSPNALWGKFVMLHNLLGTLDECFVIPPDHSLQRRPRFPDPHLSLLDQYVVSHSTLVYVARDPPAFESTGDTVCPETPVREMIGVHEHASGSMVVTNPVPAIPRLSGRHRSRSRQREH